MIQQRRVLAILRKEIFHVLRDPFTLIMALIMPLVMVLMFGSSIEFNVQKVPTVYIDHDHSQSSRTFLRTLGSSQYFSLFPARSVMEGFQMMEREKASAMVVIPPLFEEDLFGRGQSDIQVCQDGTDNSRVGAISGYFAQVQNKASQEICYPEGVAIAASASASSLPVDIKTRFLYNPELSSQWFIVPGLAAVIMAILSILLTALTIAKEWENGSMELLLSTPVHPVEIVMGKIIPYAGLGVFAVLIVYFCARYVYGLPFLGSHWIFWLGTWLFLIAYLGLGLIVSTLIHNQQAAVQTAMTIGMMPAVLLSGFIFPLEHMHPICRAIATIFPARWYVEIVRDQFLKGSSFTDLLLPFCALAVASYVVVQFCVAKFKRTLEK